jgi:hypothetical protein
MTNPEPPRFRFQARNVTMSIDQYLTTPGADVARGKKMRLRGANAVSVSRGVVEFLFIDGEGDVYQVAEEPQP